MNKWTLIFFVLCFASKAGFAQYTKSSEALSNRKPKSTYQDTVWIVSGLKTLDSKYKKWKFDFALDARQTLLSNTRARLAGVRVGMEYRRIHRFGLGIYNLGDGIIVKSLNEIDPRIDSARLNLSYVSLFYERVMYFSRKIEWSMAIHAGIGKIDVNYNNTFESGSLNFEKNVRPVELSTTCYYHLTYFVSIGAGVGYRYVFGAPEEVQPVYNAPVGIFRLRIKLIKMTKGFFSRDVREAY